MAHRVVDLPLGGNPPGTARSVRLHRFGTAGARPLVYVQGGLHATEVPGMLVADRLVRRLMELDAAGRVVGEVRVVPVANPLGLDQRVFDERIGRFDMAGNGNFNRGHADLADAVARRVEGRLGADPAANMTTIREAALAAVAALSPLSQADHLRRTLLGQAVDADIVLDLHCDEIAPLHLYLGTPLWPGAADLAGDLGAEAVFVAEVSGGHPFDEACSALWWRLAARFGPDVPIPPACLASTVELRGMADVDGGLADRDADAIVAFLTRRGAIAGTPPPLPALRCAATPLAGVDMVTSPVSGIVLILVAVGEEVAAGARVAEVLDPSGPAASGLPAPQPAALTAAAAGRVWSLTTRRFVDPGTVVVKIAGDNALPGKSELLLTP
ncbi:MAG: succinylglutamate desuccinylase/aspartoacylase family protein [Rhodospirillaceae bacterium]|nr:succinylglutamate desuccinylase/aspartoacylase family protein [Rhodospirillaceae bacterium]